MPYSSTSELPANVKKLEAKKQRQWMHIFNACAADGKPESTCFAMANGVAAKEFDPKNPDPALAEILWLAKDYQYVDSYEYSEHRIPQAAANYNPVGGSNTKACANCQFFIAPSRCSVVDGTISPTGISDLWHEVVPFQGAPIPVTIVGGAAGSKDSVPEGEEDDPIRAAVRSKIAATAKEFGVELAPQDPATIPTSNPGTTRGNGLLGILRKAVGRDKDSGSALSPVQGGRGFMVARQKDGRSRFYTAWSNNFMDREGEIFTKAAHKEFVDWATETENYPELWLWHTAGTAFGQVDWLDATDDGFVHASGLIHAGKEALAEQLAQEECGVSHGFFGLQAANLIHWYRSYELSVLPLANAAVWTTSFNLLNSGKATEMGFTPQKKEFFKNLGIDDAQISAWEKQTEGLAESLKSMGLESKAADLGVDVPPPPTPEEKAENNFRLETTKTLMAIQETMAALAGEVKEIKEKTKDIKSGDAVVAAAMTPPAAGAVVQASKSADNVVAEGAPEATASRDFFNNTVLGSLIGSGVAS